MRLNFSKLLFSEMRGVLLILSLTFGSFNLHAIEPTVPASLFSANISNCNEVDLSWVNGNGSRRIVVASAHNPVNAFPNDGVTYLAGSLFGSGSNLGNNNFVVYNSTGNSMTVTGLNAGRTYHFAIFEYNGNGASSDYLISTYPEADTVPFGVTITIIASDTVLCNGSSVSLTAQGAQTYVWTPASGLSSTTGSNVTASPSATTRYSVFGTDSLGCQAVERILLTVNPRPSVSLSSQGSMCVDDNPRTLSGGSPSGGTYSGTGVNNGEFDPSDAGVGVHSITYTYTNVQGCSNSASQNLTVNALPVVTLGSFAARCLNAGNLTLSGGSPSGGTYSGSGVSGGVFNPQTAGAGTHTITYSYTNAQGCSNSATSSITVNAPPVVSLSNFGTVCINTSPFTLTGGSPAGGTYSGTGVNAGVFNPSAAGTGNHTITYRFTNAQGCSDSTTANIQVSNLPNVTLAAFDSVCYSTGSYLLTGGDPAGGVYSGPGVSMNEFNPSAADTGVHTITYTYTDVNGCVNSASGPLVVKPDPVVTLTAIPSVCANTGPVTLSGGSPAGGTYSGNAVSNGIFFTGIAGAGSHFILYSYTASNGCTSSASRNIQVHAIPSPHLGPDTTVCANASIELNPGNGFSSYSWSNGANTPTITVDTMGRGTGTFMFRVTVSNSFSCTNRDTILVTFDICSSLPEKMQGKQIKVSPNPFSDNFMVSMQEDFELRLIDRTGRLLEVGKSSAGKYKGGNTLAPGIYFAEITSSGIRKIIRIVKTH
ncbi:MAG: T9SS C-terminal target domain-containing protein [Bacteroidetes bacterium]|nr:MAG: T9SS C-terminal target domain-containing protein [Bacteroidota bacterium]REK00671.1 MAG: T9SS C-terminal target domain-containing protein [Bacteroidota bacterium]REK35207.1 MAG: T9SS C-terminal target domain-containing protein [Bacteroidota bacterium]REK48284.1 MAG: T9SS C-terminal target domain-containing protein [Bacteroidota bacterium]